jgi:hypothetical protein
MKASPGIHPIVQSHPLVRLQSLNEHLVVVVIVVVVISARTVVIVVSA